MAVDWKSIRNEYLAGGISYRKLAEKHGIPFPTLRDRALNEHWKDQRDKVREKAVTKTINAVAAAEAKVDVRASTIAMQLLQKISNAMDHIDAMDSEAIQRYASAIERLQRVAFEKSVADLEEQKARIEKLRREAQDDKNRNEDIVVSFKGDLDDFSR